jgi:hypothetical protein
MNHLNTFGRRGRIAMLRYLSAALIWVLAAIAPCSAAVAVDAANCNPATKQYKTSAATQTLTGVTITAGSNLALIVPLSFDTNGTPPTITSLTWDADNLA